MADDTDAGLSVRQLLKMVASGDLRAVLYVFGKPDFHIWSRLGEFGAHIPDPDLESFKTRLRDILTPEVVAQLMALHRVRAPQTSRTGARRARASRPAAQANARSPKREEKELKNGVGHNRLEMG